MEKLIESGDDDRAQCTKLFEYTHEPTHTHAQALKWNIEKNGTHQKWNSDGKSGLRRITVSKSFNIEWQP